MPWFQHWNYSLLQALFRGIPHQPRTDALFAFPVRYPFVCTWPFGALFYRMWAKHDERKETRRACLRDTVAAFAVAIFITLLVRPWIAWPAPARNPAFRNLFPPYLWGEGTSNSFPSHSTLAYFLVAAGFWPFKPKLSVALSLGTLLLISLPRVYLGGHYPIDVLASLLLGSMTLAASWRWSMPATGGRWLAQHSPTPKIRKLLFLIWIVELADGFRATEFLVGVAARLSSGL